MSVEVNNVSGYTIDEANKIIPELFKDVDDLETYLTSLNLEYPTVGSLWTGDTKQILIFKQGKIVGIEAAAQKWISYVNKILSTNFKIEDMQWVEELCYY